MLIDPSSDGRHGKKAMELLASLYAALSDDTVRKAVVDAAAQAASGDYYKALPSLRPVIPYEATALARVDPASTVGETRSEERRVWTGWGSTVRPGWAPYYLKKKK